MQIQTAPDDRVATAALSAIFGAPGAAIMAVAIIISTFGCNNGLILAGARVSYAMARDGLFFRSTGALSKKGVPQSALIFQGIWVVVLILLRTRQVDASGAVIYGNLYSDLAELRRLCRAALLRAYNHRHICADDGNAPMRNVRIEHSAIRSFRLLYIVAATAIMIVLASLSNANCRRLAWLSC